MFNQGKERYEREMDLWKERKVPADERKPAAKPVAEEQAIAQETVRDVPIETRPTPEEPVVAAAAAGAPVRPGRLQQEPAASSASDEDGNTQEFTARPGVAFQGSTSSVVTNKKRKNSSPYWYKGAPVFELEGYTDGTPLRPGHVWVEYDSGTAVQVKDAELVKKLPPARNSRRRLSHNLKKNDILQKPFLQATCQQPPLHQSRSLSIIVATKLHLVSLRDMIAVKGAMKARCHSP
jgi:hypothetical protein